MNLVYTTWHNFLWKKIKSCISTHQPVSHLLLADGKTVDLIIYTGYLFLVNLSFHQKKTHSENRIKDPIRSVLLDTWTDPYSNSLPTYASVLIHALFKLTKPHISNCTLASVDLNLLLPLLLVRRILKKIGTTAEIILVQIQIFPRPDTEHISSLSHISEWFVAAWMCHSSYPCTL